MFPYLENNFLKKVKLTLNQAKLNINLMMMSPTMCPKIKTCYSFFRDITEMKITGCFGRPDAGQGKCRVDIFFQSVQPPH